MFFAFCKKSIKFAVFFYVSCFLISCAIRDQKEKELSWLDLGFAQEHIITLTPKLFSGKTLTVRVFSMQSPGLQMDEEIFMKAFSDHFVLDHIEVAVGTHVDLNLFIEHSRYDQKPFARENWLLVNQEQMQYHDLPQIDAVFCRHSGCTDVMARVAKERKLNYKLYQTTFSSNAKIFAYEDLDFSHFVHPAGKSPYKNTRAVMDVWRENPDLPKLYVTCYGHCELEAFGGDHNVSLSYKQIPNIAYFNSRLEDEVFEKIQKIGFLVAPSAVEGYGHYINEAKVRGAIIVTTNASPMNELVHPNFGFFVPVSVSSYYGAARAPWFSFQKQDLLKAVRQALQLTDTQRRAMGELAKKSFQEDRENFSKRLYEIVLERFYDNKPK